MAPMARSALSVNAYLNPSLDTLIWQVMDKGMPAIVWNCDPGTYVIIYSDILN